MKMHYASVFLIIFVSVINDCSSGFQSLNEASDQKEVRYDFNCTSNAGIDETCSVTLYTEDTLQEVTEQFSDLIKDRNATMVRFWLTFPDYNGFNPMLLNTSHAYGLWLWHWLYNEKGRSLLYVPHSAEFYSFTTVFLRGPHFEVLFRDYNGSSQEIAHLPECCKVGFAARFISNVTYSSDSNAQKERNHLCHRFVDNPETDAKVEFKCCHLISFWENENTCFEPLKENKWMTAIAFSALTLSIILWLLVLPVVCWYILSAAIIEQPILWKKFIKREEKLKLYVREGDLIACCTKQPVTISTISRYWHHSPEKPNKEDSSGSKTCHDIGMFLKRLMVVMYFALVVPVCVILLVIIGPIFLGYTDKEVEAWTMSTNFKPPSYEMALFMPYPFETWRVFTVCVLYVIYSLVCSAFVLMFGDALGTRLCVKHQKRETTNCENTSLYRFAASKLEYFFSQNGAYEHFLRTVSPSRDEKKEGEENDNQDEEDENNEVHLYVNVLAIVRKLQINFAKALVNKDTWKTRNSTHEDRLKSCLDYTLTLFTRLPPISFFIFIYYVTKGCVRSIIKKHKVVFSIFFPITVLLLTYFVLLITLWIILYSFGFTLMGIALNPDILAPIIAVVLIVLGYVLAIYYSFVESYDHLTQLTFEIMLMLGEDRKDRKKYGIAKYVSDVVDDKEDEIGDPKTLVFENVIYAESGKLIDSVRQDALCFVFDKVQPVRHKFGAALIKLSSIVIFIMFAFFVIMSFDIPPALETALVTITGAVPAALKTRGTASSGKNKTNKLLRKKTNKLLRKKIECALTAYESIVNVPKMHQNKHESDHNETLTSIQTSGQQPLSLESIELTQISTSRGSSSAT